MGYLSVLRYRSIFFALSFIFLFSGQAKATKENDLEDFEKTCPALLEVASGLGTLLADLGLLTKTATKEGEANTLGRLGNVVLVAEYLLPKFSFLQNVNSPVLFAVAYRLLAEMGFTSRLQVGNFFGTFNSWPLDKQNEWMEALTFWTLYEFRSGVGPGEGSERLGVSEPEFVKFRKVLESLKASNYLELKLLYFAQFQFRPGDVISQVMVHAPPHRMFRGMFKRFFSIFRKKSVSDLKGVLTASSDLKDGRRFYTSEQILRLAEVCKEAEAWEALEYLVVIKSPSLIAEELRTIIGFFPEALVRERLRRLYKPPQFVPTLGSLLERSQADTHVRQLENRLTMIRFLLNWYVNLQRINELRDIDPNDLVEQLQKVLLVETTPDNFINRNLAWLLGSNLGSSPLTNLVSMVRQLPALGSLVGNGEEALNERLALLRELLARYVALAQKNIPELPALLKELKRAEKETLEELEVWRKKPESPASGFEN